jgi:uncharacterized protein (UPF0332 family)
MGESNMTYNECFEKGLLRKAHVPKEEIEHQLKIAEDYLKKAEVIFEKEIYDISFLTVYISLFHSARGLLYSKGYKERSHFCLFEFVRFEFKNEPEIVRLAEISHNYREIRHMVQYEGSLCSKESAKEAINDADDFLKAVKRMLIK